MSDPKDYSIHNIELTGNTIIVDPVYDKVKNGSVLLLKSDREDEYVEGGELMLPEGFVVSVGYKCKEISVGDYVVFGKHIPDIRSVGGKKYYWLYENQVIAKIKE